MKTHENPKNNPRSWLSENQFHIASNTPLNFAYTKLATSGGMASQQLTSIIASSFSKHNLPLVTIAEPETIDRGCPVQINRIFGSIFFFFTIRPLFFSEPKGCPGADRRLPWIRPCWLQSQTHDNISTTQLQTQPQPTSNQYDTSSNPEYVPRNCHLIIIISNTTQHNTATANSKKS
jgi:hypothetical protein